MRKNIHNEMSFIGQLPTAPDCFNYSPIITTIDGNFSELYLSFEHSDEHYGTNALVLVHDHHLDLCLLDHGCCLLVLLAIILAFVIQVRFI